MEKYSGEESLARSDVTAGVRGFGVKGLKSLRFLSGGTAADGFTEGQRNGLLDKLRRGCRVHLDQFLEDLVSGILPDEGGGDFLCITEQGSSSSFVQKVRGRIVLEIRAIQKVETIRQSGDFFPEAGHDAVVESGAQTPNAWRGRGDVAEPFPEERSVVDIIAKLREVKLGRAKVIGSLGLEELRTDPLQDTGPFGGRGLLLFLRWHVAEMQLFLDQAPLLEGIVVSKHVGGEAFQVETPFLGVCVMAVHAVFAEEGKDTIVKAGQISFKRCVGLSCRKK